MVFVCYMNGDIIDWGDSPLYVEPSQNPYGIEYKKCCGVNDGWSGFQICCQGNGFK
jgi:hypothetical protein